MQAGMALLIAMLFGQTEAIFLFIFSARIAAQ